MGIGQKHTPEPWVNIGGDLFGFGGEVQNNFTRHPVVAARLGIGLGADDGSGERMANGNRIIDCVNACAGMDDPRAEIQRLRAELAAVKAAHSWQPIKTAPEGANVLIHYKNSGGKSRIIKAVFIPRFYREDTGDSDELDCEYCGHNGHYYWPEGWYEAIDNWGDYSFVFVGEGLPDSWMPLPPAPNNEPNKEEGE